MKRNHFGGRNGRRARRLAALLMATLLALLSAAAVAEEAAIETAGETEDTPDIVLPAFEGELLLTGTVGFRREDALKAPVTGDLAPFDWRVGDVVKAGETAFAVAPETAYATLTGTVGETFAAPGDDAAAIQARYGMLMALEYANPLIVSASTRTAYDKPANKRVALGETIYIRSRESARYTGVGRVVKVSGMDFTVEVTSGNLRFDESVNLYRDPKYDDTTRVARATVSALDATAVTCAGTVLAVHKARGDAVKPGDPLLDYVPDVLAPDEYKGDDTLRVAAEADRVLTQINATQGMSVQKGQVLAMWADASALRLTANVAEGDVGRLSPGMRATITFEDLNVPKIAGVVVGISSVGSQADESEYAVSIDFDAAPGILSGMHATALFTAE